MFAVQDEEPIEKSVGAVTPRGMVPETVEVVLREGKFYGASISGRLEAAKPGYGRVTSLYRPEDPEAYPQLLKDILAELLDVGDTSSAVGETGV